MKATQQNAPSNRNVLSDNVRNCFDNLPENRQALYSTVSRTREIWRVKEVLRQTGLCRTNLYDSINNGLFTRPVRIGARAVGWPAGEVIMINMARIMDLKDDEVRNLVLWLEEERKNAFGGANNEGE